MDTQSATEEPTVAGRMSESKAWMIASAAVVLLLIAVGFVLVTNGGGSDQSSANQSSSSLDRPATAGWMMGGCAAWAQSVDSPSGPTSDWCSSMATWMSSNGWGRGAGQGAPMMGAMMSGDAGAMREACKAWVRSVPPATTSGSAAGWCDQMADWMAGSQGGWMMDGN